MGEIWGREGGCGAGRGGRWKESGGALIWRGGGGLPRLFQNFPVRCGAARGGRAGSRRRAMRDPMGVVLKFKQGARAPWASVPCRLPVGRGRKE